MSETKSVFTVNEVVAFNLARARRRKGWTQEETAARLTASTGKRWTKATLGAAERSWETSRVREFNANELLAFALIFDQPVAYFLLPPDIGDGTESFALGALPVVPATLGEGEERFGELSLEVKGMLISALQLLHHVLPFRPSHEFFDAANAATRKHGLSWSPGRASWYRIEEQEPLDLEDEERRKDMAMDAMPAAETVIDEAKRRKMIEYLRQIERLVDPGSWPPF